MKQSQQVIGIRDWLDDDPSGSFRLTSNLLQCNQQLLQSIAVKIERFQLFAAT